MNLLGLRQIQAPAMLRHGSTVQPSLNPLRNMQRRQHPRQRCTTPLLQSTAIKQLLSKQPKLQPMKAPEMQSMRPHLDPPTISRSPLVWFPSTQRWRMPQHQPLPPRSTRLLRQESQRQLSPQPRPQPTGVLHQHRHRPMLPHP